MRLDRGILHLVLLCAACEFDRASIPTQGPVTEGPLVAPDSAPMDDRTCEPGVDCDAGRDAAPHAVDAGPIPKQECSTAVHDCRRSDAGATSDAGVTPEGGVTTPPAEGCAAGFEPDEDGGCDDLDECTAGQHDCDPLRACINTDGGFRCGACPSGYDAAGNQCVDTDECQWASDPCPSPALCVNTVGSYHCECRSGYERNLDARCVDVDECAAASSPCDDVAFCRNAAGSYTCACPRYYTDDDAGHVCRDTRHRWSTTLVSTNGLVMAPDRDGNLFLVSMFTGLTQFGGQSLAAAGQDLIVAKLDSAREVVWFRQLGGPQDEVAEWIAVDGEGDVLVVGQAAGGFDMGCGLLTSQPLTRYVAKFRGADGACAWSALMPHAAGATGEQDYWMTLAVDSANNVLVAGQFFSTLDVGATHLSSAGGPDIYVAKFSPIGDVLWARRWGTASAESSHGIAVYPDDNIALLGSFNGYLSIGGELFASRGSQDVVLAKLTPDGDHIWTRQDGGSGADWPGNLAIDPAGNAFMAGYFYGVGTFGDDQLTSRGIWDVFATKFNAEGSAIWTRHIAGDGEVLAWDVAADDQGNTFVTGPFNGTADFGEGGRTGLGTFDVFVVKFAPDGQHVWSQRFGGDGYDTSGYVHAGPGGQLYVAGWFMPPVDFGDGPQTSGSAFVMQLSH